MSRDSSAPLDPEDRALMTRLLHSAEVDVAPVGYERRLLQRLAQRSAPRGGNRTRHVRRLLILAAAFAIVIVLRARSKTLAPKARPAPSHSAEIAAEPASSLERGVAPSSIRRTPEALCVARPGGAPLVDDFEDHAAERLSVDGHSGKWCLVLDSDPATCRPARFLPRPESSPKNRLAVHFQTGELHDWGAALEVKIEPGCADVSAYTGIGFFARGPGRLYVAAREVRVVSADAGGTCLRDCYNDHAHRVELGASFRHFEVRWSELHQRGYQMPPLDPRKLFSLAFVVHADDTPSDVWIDDVELLMH